VLLLGIDIGTTNWKAVIYDAAGRPRALRKTAAMTRYDANGWGYYDPAELWAHVSRVIHEAVDEVGGQVDAVSVTSMAEAVVPLDSAGQPTHPIIAWFDTRSVRQAERIASEIGRERLFALTGLEPNAIFSLAKILWIREHVPDAYRQARVWLQMSDYVLYRLSGQFATDYSLASRTLMFDLHRNAWSDELLEHFAVAKDTLPEIMRSGTRLGSVSRHAAMETGLQAGTPVVVGGHDHPCAALASGVQLGRKTLDSSGTAESFVTVSQPDAPPPVNFAHMRMCRYLDQRCFTVFGGILAGGASFDWAIDRFGSLADWGLVDSRIDYAMIEVAAARVAIGADGLLFLPHLRGSGAPHWNARDRGAFLGLTTNHGSAQLIRAVIEGLAMQARWIVETTEAITGAPADALVCVGGGARVALWQQIKADVLGRTVEAPDAPEATSLGAALLAGIGIGVYPDMVSAARAVYNPGRIYNPRPEQTARYEPLYRLFQSAYNSITDINAGLDALTR
jgi:xylulokinase